MTGDNGLFLELLPFSGEKKKTFKSRPQNRILYLLGVLSSFMSGPF